MKKLVAQFVGYKGTTSSTLQDYRIIYTVPDPENPDEYSDTIFSDVVIYIYNNANDGGERQKMNFNIRILKKDDSLLNPNLQPAGEATTNEESLEYKYKGVIINNPSKTPESLPLVFKNIYLQSGDSIAVQALDDRISIQVFAEELQYDNDALFKMLKDQQILNRQTRTANANTIAQAIHDHETQYTCVCSSGGN